MGNPRARLKTRKTLAQLLTERLPPPTPDEERRALVDQLALTITQRDDALRQLDDRANIEQYSVRLRVLSTDLADAIRALTAAVKTVRRFLDLGKAD